jgi:hypothetical protein
MTTITTTGQQHAPLIAGLAAGAALVVGVAIGVAWEQDDNTAAHHHTLPATGASLTTVHSFGGVTTGEEVSGSVTGHLPETARFGGATTAEESTGGTP